MSKKGKKQKKRNERKQRKRQAAVFERSADERTARFVAGRLADIQQDLSDLLADLRTFDHYEQVVNVGLCLWTLQRVKRKYEKFTGKDAWEDEKD